MTGASYSNPVWPRSFPDPFVLKHQGEYWAYSTGLQEDGRAFGVLRSRDLVTWEPRPGAMAPLPGDHPCYWAPEVSRFDGRFYLYYSVGNEEWMEIRVAVADHPGGPFEDSGRRLTREKFAIDAHVHQAADGSRWLFYATDFLEHSHVGTGTVRDRLLDPFSLAGDPRPVTLPRHDWHLYHPNRPEKGGARWHTVEGSFVLERKGRLYQMFSGGNWQEPTYGVSYATAGSVADGEEWEQAADGVRVLPVLRSGGEVVGPGHNSVVRGPDNRQLWCVYHRWSAGLEARVMALDPLDFAGDRLLVLGPTTGPRPAPNGPTLRDLIPPDPPAVLPPGGERRWEAGSPSFLAEVGVRAAEGRSCVCLQVLGARKPLLRIPLRLEPWVQTLRLEVDGGRVSVAAGSGPAARHEIAAPAVGFALVAERKAVELSALELTVGWEERFEEAGAPRGWEALDGRADWVVEEGELAASCEDMPDPTSAAWLARGPALEDYELVVNARLLDTGGGDAWGVAPAVPAAEAGAAGPRLLLARRGKDWALEGRHGQIFPLPAAFDPFQYQQLRFLRRGGAIEVSWEGVALGTLEGPPGPARVALGARGAAWFDAVRVTTLSEAGG